MKKAVIFILLIFVSIISCTSKGEKSNFTLPDTKDISSIVETIIFDKKLPFTKEYLETIKASLNDGEKALSYVIPLSKDLRKIRITISEQTGEDVPPLAPGSNLIDIQKLLDFFKKSDSLYLLFQNKNLDKFEIPDTISDRLLTTTIAEQKANRQKHIRIRFYDLTIPIFSADKTKAYVELTYNCTGLCGGATAIFLEKKNGKWIIADEYQLWIS